MFLSAQVPETIILSDHKILFEGTDKYLYYFYAIRNDLLVYTKDEGAYKTGYKIELEITSEDDKSIRRYFKDSVISTDSYTESISRIIYREGFIRIPLDFRKFNVKPIITNTTSLREFRQPGFYYNQDSLKKSFFLVGDIKNINSESIYAQLISRGRNIPFVPNSVNFILPFRKYADQKVNVIVESNGKKIEFIPEILKGTNVRVIQDSSGILLEGYRDSSNSLLLIKDFNLSLPEGDASIRITLGTDTSFFKTSARVQWFNKPRSLMDENLAVKLVELLETEEKSDSLRKAVRKAKTNALFEYWKKHDPTPLTEYNELMAEFYFRADEANIRFSTLRGGDGALTDRGNIFVKFGEPEKIERGTTPEGRMSEIWYYHSPNRVFRFVDRNGAGNYELR
ncbi:MAG: GWxTD domain-containing protein [Ignavibacteriaceae bacterium]|nr:GWxTD domain-containing protein [Ignavibacteriaceae bacterium]